MKQTAASIDRVTKNAITALNTYLLLMAFGMVLWIVTAIWLLAPFNSNKDHYEKSQFNYHISNQPINRRGNLHLAISAAYSQLAGKGRSHPASNAPHVRTPHQRIEKPDLLRKA